MCVCVCVCERETDRQTKTKDSDTGLGVRLTDDCYIDTFLNRVVSLYSGSYVLASLMVGSQLEATGGRLFPPPGHSLTAL